MKFSLTHKLLLQYITYCSKDQRGSIIDTVKDHLPEIIHTRDGAHVACLALWNANKKFREVKKNLIFLKKYFFRILLKVLMD